MDLLKDIIEEHAPKLLGQLQSGAGFDPEQAQRFLPEAGSSIGQAMSDGVGDLDLTNLSSAANISALSKGIDVRGLADRTGVSPQQGLDGIQALLPAVLGFLGQKAGNAGDLLGLLGGASGAGDALGALKQLGGKFFR